MNFHLSNDKKQNNLKNLFYKIKNRHIYDIFLQSNTYTKHIYCVNKYLEFFHSIDPARQFKQSTKTLSNKKTKASK